MTQRTPLVSGISYVGTDGEGHVTVAGEKIAVASDDLAHYDWIHDATPEARHAAAQKKAEAGEKAAANAAKAAAPKAAEKS